MRLPTVFFAVVQALSAGAFAQSYSIDWHSIDPGGAGAGDAYSMEGGIIQTEAVRMAGGGLTLEGGFGSGAGPSLQPVNIFDNSTGSDNGGTAVTASIWLAGRLCIRTQAYALESVSLLLNSQDFSGAAGPPAVVQLRLYSSDPASGKPMADTGLVMNLFGRTNPIVLLRGLEMVKWVPAEAFVLSAGQCYWAVVSAENGKRLGLTGSFSRPSGDAGSFGVSRSVDSGATWGTPDNASNLKMLVRGVPHETPAPTPPLAITAVGKIGNELRVSFASAAGKTYAFQVSDDLSSDLWTTLTDAPVVGSGSVLEVILPANSDQPWQFFRIMIVR